MNTIEDAAAVYHSAADGANTVIRNHAEDLPIEQLCAVSEYRDYLREQANRLEDLSFRLHEQGRRLEQEKGSFLSCRFCGEPGEWEEGVCVHCDVTLYAPSSTPEEDGRR